MNPSLNLPVLIVGAGPSGLTLGCDLARRGVPFRLVDKAAVPFAGSRAKGLMPRTLEVFQDLGIAGAILASGSPFPPFRAYSGETVLWERDIRDLAGFPRLEPSPHLPFIDFWMLPQSRTDEILRQRLLELRGEPGGRVELGRELVALRQDEAGVLATLVDGAGREETVRAEFLVGADGGGSFVRKALGIPFLGETLESDRSLLADVQVEGLDREVWHTWIDPENPRRRVSLCPLPSTDLFQLAAPLAEEEEPELSLVALQELFWARSGRRNSRFLDLRWASLHRVNIRMAERFRLGRAFLIGDAAHVHSPAGGQGLNTGIQDAYNLGWKLGAVLAGAAPEALLESFEAERLPIAAGVLGLTSALHRKGFRPPSDADAASAHGDIYQLKLHYRESLLSQDARENPGRVRAGDRAPDAPCSALDGTPRRLFDLFQGPHFTLLAFGPEAEALVAEVGPKYGDSLAAYAVRSPRDAAGGSCLLDPEGAIHRGYDVAPDAVGSCSILVRPDGYIGRIEDSSGRSLDPLARFLWPASSRRSVTSALASA